MISLNPDSAKLRAIVVGGGVAGSAVAVALRRAGVAVTVYEAYDDPAGPVGSFVSLASNGLRGLERLGCLAAVQVAGVAIARQRMWSAGGRLLGDVPRGRRRDDPLHSVTLMRGDLVAVLRAAATAAGATIHPGVRVTGVTETPGAVGVERGTEVPGGVGGQLAGGGRVAGALGGGVAGAGRVTGVAGTPGGVSVELAGGGRDSADLLVAADGIWSAVRGRLDPAAPRPEYAGLYAVSGVSTMDDVEPGVFNMTFGRNGAFLHLAAGDGRVWWQAQVADPAAPARHGVSDEQWLRRTAELYRREPVPAAVIAATTRLHPAVLMHAVDPVPTWHSDRIVLVGDAAHPVGAGQGASMAVEDALALAGAVSAAPTVAAALAAYETGRRPRVTRLLAAAEDNRGAKKAGPVKRHLQAAMMRVFIPLFYERATAWLYSAPARP